MSELLDFHKLVNNNCSALKFTIEFHQEKIYFLDVFVIKSVSALETSLYRKPTDRNTLLHGTSYHHELLKRSLPMSKFSRMRCRLFVVKRMIFNIKRLFYQTGLEQEHMRRNGFSQLRIAFRTGLNVRVL